MLSSKLKIYIKNIKILFSHEYCRVGEALIFGSWMLGQALAYAPNVSAAIISASRIMNLLKRKPTIADPPNITHPSSDVKGEINFRSVNFCYPSRKDILVLKDFNLEIEAGKTIALVGASGSVSAHIVSSVNIH